MRRKSDEDAGLILLLGVLVGLVFLLFGAARALVGVGVHAYRRWNSGGHANKSSNATHNEAVADDAPTLILGDDFIECRNFMALQDWDAARQALQRIAYTMPDRPAEEKMRFTGLMAEFAAGDPLVGSVLRIITPLLQAEPGLLQSNIYKHMPGIGPEEARYALYFLEQLGMIRREKSGRSYRLYLLGDIIDI